ncbi:MULTISPECIES: ABC transporter ATP-binding protein [Clostridium]|uniref:ABC transporter ATP-binding protein n=1 Tax=Clostridium TaxID=1485 RepID=UPI000825791C|nr:MULTISPECIES: ATP-binding cassette domain-containing protein [Clostridium]PJI07877.1 methionine ABC transporter ATP-binding protein [Clostridium sp. CT7]
MNLLEFKEVSYVNGSNTILKNINVNIDSGDFVSVVGHSGSGKSTFFKMCADLISPTEGSIIYRNKEYSKYNPMELRKKIVYCFQIPHLLGDTVLDNFKFPYNIRSVLVDYDRINELMDDFKFTHDYLNKDVRNLSGGEKQRIALIRSLLFKPDILLLDEATSALDADNTIIVENVIKGLNKEGITIMWITHNKEQSTKYANKVITLEDGEIKSMEVLKNE